LGVMRGLRVGRRVDLGLVVFMPQRTDGPLPSSLETQIRRKFGGIPQLDPSYRLPAHTLAGHFPAGGRFRRQRGAF